MMKTALRNVGTIITGNTPSKGNEDYWDSSDICFVKPDIIADSGITVITETIEHISEAARSKARIVGEGTIFVTCIGSIGKIAIASTNEYAFNQQINAIVPYDCINSRYLAYALLYAKPRLTAIANAPVVPIINKSQFGEFELEIEENIDKQVAIVDLLDKISGIIDARQKQIHTLDILIKARFVEMFGDQEANFFGWQQSTIGETCTLKSGTSLPTEVENEGGTIPYVKVGDMNYPGNERYITTSSRFVTEKTAGKGIFPVGSILFPKRGGAIGTNKKRMTVLPVCADLNVMGVTSNGGLVAEYLMAFFDMIDLGALDNGSSVPQINNKDIAPLRICVPPIELQEQFAAFVSQVDKSKSVIQQALSKDQLLFDSLMQQYFG